MTDVSYALCITIDGEVVALFPIPAVIAQSRDLVMERLTSWAIDEQLYHSAQVSPEIDEEGQTYFQLDFTTKDGTSATAIAAVLRVTRQ